MAQQVFYPNDPLQPGPVYFLTPRKCAIFGVCSEAIPRQVNYLIDENFDVGKGANAIISMLDHFFDHHGLGERKVHLHADNCSGQNKNSTMVHYLLHRVMTGKHDTITLSFMIAGHTKLRCFGLLKKKYRRTCIGGLPDLVEVVNNSSVVNVAYFAPVFVKLKGIKKLHHIRFQSDSPGFVFVKEFSNSDENEVCLIKKGSQSLLPGTQPPQLTATGLSLQRQWYLYNKIREFCPEDMQDTTCPLPTQRLDDQCTPSRSPSPVPASITDSPNFDEPQQKRRRHCGLCHKTGHNSRTCPEK